MSDKPSVSVFNGSREGWGHERDGVRSRIVAFGKRGQNLRYPLEPHKEIRWLAKKSGRFRGAASRSMRLGFTHEIDLNLA